MRSFLIEQFNLVVLVAICIVAAIGQAFGLFTGLTGPLALALAAAFAAYQIVENLKIARQLDEIRAADLGRTLRILHSAREFFSFATGIVTKANSSIDACYFTPQPPTDFYGDDEIKRYWDKIGELMRSNPQIMFRRLATVDTVHKARWIEAHIREFSDCNNYSFGILENDGALPLMNVMIVDLHSTFIFVPHSAKSRNYVWVRDALYSSGVMEYFDHMWGAAVIIKDGPTVKLPADLASLAGDFDAGLSAPYNLIDGQDG